MINKKIAIDVDALMYLMWKGKFPTGVNRVTLEYIKHYKHNAIAAFHCKKRYFFIKNKVSQQLFEAFIAGKRKYSKWNAVKFIVKMLFSLDLKINHSKMIIFNTGHTSFQLKEKFRNLTLIFMSHDVIPAINPEYSSLAINHRYSINMDNIISIAGIARVILCNSQDTENQLKEYALANNIKLPRTQVALLGNNLVFYENDVLPVLSSKYVSREYFVILSTIEPKKNHMILLHIWKRLLVNKFIDSNSVPNLLIIGKRGWKCNDVTNVLDNCTIIKNHVFELNNCSDLELQAYLKKARALLFPSFVEGFGFPLVEALGVGTPVIVSDLPVFHEIADNIPEYLDPLDGLGWMNMIMEYAKPDSEMRNKQLERMIGYKVPTWEDHFNIVDNIRIFLESSW